MFSASAMPRILQRAPSSLFFQFCAQCVCNILKVIGDVFLGEKIVFLHADGAFRNTDTRTRTMARSSQALGPS